MNHLLSLSQAARMVGVPRKVLQHYIQRGKLSVFEGSVRQSELLKIFPDTNTDRSGMIEKVRNIQADAINKYMSDSMPSPEQLVSEVQRLRAELRAAEEKVESYRDLVAEMKIRMSEYQDQCDKNQSQMLSSLVGWFYSQCKLREKR
jgi:DNA-binding transcriptional MerR regulator